MSPHAAYYSDSAGKENDSKKKRELAEKALGAISECHELAKLSGYTWQILVADFLEAGSLSELAKIESDVDRRRALLEKAVDCATKSVKVFEKWDAGMTYNLAINHMNLADILCDLAEATADHKSKIRALNEAIGLKRKAQEEFAAGMTKSLMTNDPASHYTMGYSQGDLGRRYLSLFEIAPDSNDLNCAIECFEEASDSYLRAGQPSRAAECLWEAARANDRLGEHLKSSERFDEASKQYREASEKIRSLGQFYKNQSLYMDAWSEIEKARYHHARQEPASAREHYDRAADLHESTGKWSYLSSNYSAWAQVENAEDLSQKEKCKESIDAFTEASRLFKNSKSKMQEQLAKIEDSDEKQMVGRLIGAADNRRELCKARISLEEARLLDKGGNLSSASEKYGLAAEMFTKIKQRLTTEQDRKEIELMITLSRAWKAMAKAEAESSPIPYAEAAHLFDDAKNLSLSDKAKNLAMGHSRFCKALAAGVQFADTGDASLYSTATQHLESASKYYLKADMSTASDYAKASKLLFDSYVYMNKASKEENQDKKAKLCAMAEKMLEASASSYGLADQPGKRDLVLRLLRKAKEDREFAASLTDIFRAPDFASTTMVFSTPTPTLENATGLEMFENANVQATLIARPMDVNVGESLDLEIELVNAGRGSAQLIKLLSPVPNGFTLREEPKSYRMEDDYLNLRGKRLDPLMTEEITLALKPTHPGEFALKPRILYLDEGGKYKSHEPEPMRVTVCAEATVHARKAVPTDTREAAEARSLLAGLNVVTLSYYRIVGNYVRYGEDVRSSLKDARQKILAACGSSSPKRENYIIWAPPGSGKTYFVQEIATLLGKSVHYLELNLAKLDEAGFRSGLAGLRNVQGPSLCLVDEVDAKAGEAWPYEALMPFLDASATEGARLVFVLAGSSGSSLEEMKKAIASRPKGSDILSRVPTDNEYTIPPMGVGDRLLVVLSQLRQAGRQTGHEVQEIEKLGLYYVVLNPRLSNARQLREFAVRCAERVLPGDDRLKYDSLFHPGDLENKLFWTQARQSAGALVNSFLLIED